MERRRFVSSLPAVGVALSTGCAGRGGWNPAIDGNEVVLSPGEESTITVDATDIGGFSFQPTPDGIAIETTLSEIDVSPPPDSGNDSHPPQWFWSSRTDVTVDAPIAIADSMEPGEYQYGVTVYPHDHSEQEAHAQFDLTITSR